MSGEATHRVERDGAVATVTLDRPDALNAQTRASRRALIRDLRALSADTAVRCVVLTGAGRAFCAGPGPARAGRARERRRRDPRDLHPDRREPRGHAQAGRRRDQRRRGRRGALDRAGLRPALHGRGSRAHDGVLEHRPRARLRRHLAAAAHRRLRAGLRARRDGRGASDAAEALALGLVQRVLPRDEVLPRRAGAGAPSSLRARRSRSAGRSACCAPPSRARWPT